MTRTERSRARRSSEARAGARVRAARRRMLAAQRRADAELARVWARIEAALRPMVADLGRQPPDAAAIARRIHAIIDPTARERVRAVVRGTASAAGAGYRVAAEVPEAAFGELGAAAIRREAGGVAPDAAMRLALRHLEGDAAVNGLRLTDRLHGRANQHIGALASELREGLLVGRRVDELAQRLLEVDDVRVELPRYVTDLYAAVRGGDRPRLRHAVARHVEAMEGLRDPTLRAAARRFRSLALRANIEDLERQLAFWVRDRALYTERVVVRTETARAFTAAFTESTREQPWVKGYRWNLSPEHPEPDICDLYANQALDGLGPGGYLESPSIPAHPNCLCFLTAIIDEQHFERELAAARGDEPPPEAWRDPRRETAADWLARQNAGLRRAILGPGRERVFQVDPARVVGPRGALRPLWQIEGRPQPTIRRGPVVRAAEADPFREAGARAPTSRAEGDAPAPPTPPPPPRAAPPPPPAPPPVPAPAAPAAPAALDDPRRPLREGRFVADLGPLGGGGVNGARRVRLEHEGVEFDVVFKASAAEGVQRPNIPRGTMAMREAVSYSIDRLLGSGGVVPPTIERDLPVMGPGSLQLFDRRAFGTERIPERLSAAVLRALDNSPSARRITLLDLLAANDDRHAGNFMMRELDGRIELVAIDNGLTWPEGAPARFIPLPSRSMGDLLDFSELRELRELDLGSMESVMREGGLGRRARLGALVRARALQRSPAALARMLAGRSARESRDFLARWCSLPADRLLSDADRREVEGLVDR